MLKVLVFCSQIEKVLISHDGERGRGGWYLEEVTVDVPSREEHVVFPCMSWLDADHGDGATVRELNAKPGNISFQACK